MSLTEEQRARIAQLTTRYAGKAMWIVQSTVEARDCAWLLDLVRELDERASKAEDEAGQLHVQLAGRSVAAYQDVLDIRCRLDAAERERDELRRSLDWVLADNGKLSRLRAKAEAERDALKARVAELEQEERDAQVAPNLVAACGSRLECGGDCILTPGHDGPCRCAGDVDGPGTCSA